MTTPPSSPSTISDNVDNVAKRHRAPTVSRILRELEKFSTLRSRHFVPAESFAEETDSSTQVTVTSDASSQLETSPGVRSMFAKNRQKISGTVPRNVNLQYLKQISTGGNFTNKLAQRVKQRQAYGAWQKRCTNSCNEILLHVLIHRIYTKYLPYFGVISGNFLKCCRHKNGLLKSCSKIGQKLPKAAFTLSSKKLVKLTSQESLRRIGDIGESEFMFPLQIQRKFEKKFIEAV